MKLYELSAQIEACIKDETTGDMIDTETGEVFDPEAFEKLEGEFEQKCLDLARWVKNLDAERGAVYDEARKLTKRKQALDRKIDSIKSYLSFVLDGRSMKDANTELKFRKSVSTEVDIKKLMAYDGADNYLTYKEPIANKTEIAKALKEGKDIPGCSLVENLNLQIK